MIEICEVGPRDGLQNESTVLTLAQRATLINRLGRAGVSRIEVGSFVSERAVPAMAGTEHLLAAIDVPDECRLAALILNLRGYERLQNTSVTDVRFTLIATETFNQRNQRASVENSMAQAEEVVRRSHADGRKVAVTIGAAFGCPFEGFVDPGRVVAMGERLAAAGVDELVLADTIGVAVPSQVRQLVGELRGAAPVTGVHLHNTRNTGFANALTAIEFGATVLDASVGGAGGCPFAPRAGGNLATEDLAYLLEREGVPTGVDIEALSEIATWLGSVLGRKLDGGVHRAGLWWPSLPA